jgi:hypothetical protein
MEWQPIETAPRDGARILLVRGDYIWLDDWWKGDGANSNWSSLVAWKQATGKTPDPPTHWMPLPAPPEVKQ